MILLRSESRADQLSVVFASLLFLGGCASTNPSRVDTEPPVAAPKADRSYETFRSRLLDKLIEFEGAFELVRAGDAQKDFTTATSTVQEGTPESGEHAYEENLWFLKTLLSNHHSWLDFEEFDQLVLARSGPGCGHQVDLVELAPLFDLNRNQLLLFTLENVGEGTAKTETEDRIFTYFSEGHYKCNGQTIEHLKKDATGTSSSELDEIKSIRSKGQLQVPIQPGSRGRVVVKQTPPTDSRLVCKTSSLKVFKTDERKLELLYSILQSKTWRERPSIKHYEQELTPRKEKEIQRFIKEMRNVINQSKPVAPQPMDWFVLIDGSQPI